MGVKCPQFMYHSHPSPAPVFIVAMKRAGGGRKEQSCHRALTGDQDEVGTDVGLSTLNPLPATLIFSADVNGWGSSQK